MLIHLNGSAVTTTRGHWIIDWRNTDNQDGFGDPVQEAYVHGVGWCEFSNRLSALLIEGEWVLF